ncbi:MAG: EamA family transporter [Burkholderiaceae bacterium]
MTPFSIPHLALVLNAGLWGLSWIPYKAMEAQGLSILWATALAYAALTLGLFLMHRSFLRGQLHGRNPLWAMALCYGLTNTCFNWALALGDVVRVVLLFYLMPVWSACFARWLLHERLGLEGVARLLLALAGAVIVLGGVGSAGGAADLLAIAGGLFFGLANVLLRKAEHQSQTARLWMMFAGSGLVPLLILLLMAGLMALQLWPSQSLGSASPPWTANPEAFLWLPAVVLGLALANFALQYGASRLPAQVTSLLMLSEIVFAAASAALLLGAMPPPHEWIGGLLIVAAAAWASLRPPK